VQVIFDEKKISADTRAAAAAPSAVCQQIL
jgi:hypothetical protein